MVEKQRKVVSLMPAQQVRAISPWHSIEEVLVVWSSDPNDGDMFKCGRRNEGGKWVDAYAPARAGLDKLQIAGGIDELESETSELAERKWYGKCRMRYTTPAGKTIPLYGEYGFDVRVGGTRWEEKKYAEMKRLVTEKSKAKYLSAEGVIRTFSTLPPEDQEEITLLAEGLATRYVIQAAQYGRQRAQTGARLRALRKYFAIRTYTKEQLDNSAFLIQRTYVNWDAAKEVLGDKAAMMLAAADFAKQHGLSEGVIGMVSGLLGAKTSEAVEPVPEVDLFDATLRSMSDATSDAEENGADVIESTAEPVPDGAETISEEQQMFSVPASKETLGRAKQVIVKVHDLEMITPAILDEKTAAIFARPASRLSEGEMQSVVALYEELKVAKDAGGDVAALQKRGAEIMPFIRKAAQESRLNWQPETGENKNDPD